MKKRIVATKYVLNGAARLLDLGASSRIHIKKSVLNDADATRSDWVAVGQDLRDAFARYEAEYGQAQ